jgi:hypothetical protein
MRYEPEGVKADTARLEAGSGCGLVQVGDSERDHSTGESIVESKVAQKLGAGIPLVREALSRTSSAPPNTKR